MVHLMDYMNLRCTSLTIWINFFLILWILFDLVSNIWECTMTLYVFQNLNLLSIGTRSLSRIKLDIATLHLLSCWKLSSFCEINFFLGNNCCFTIVLIDVLVKESISSIWSLDPPLQLLYVCKSSICFSKTSSFDFDSLSSVIKLAFVSVISDTGVVEGLKLDCSLEFEFVLELKCSTFPSFEFNELIVCDHNIHYN